MSDAVQPEESEGDTAIERIADPENYNIRRRLKQLHDAKERARDTSARASRAEITNRKFEERQRDRLVAEAVADYILELKSVLRMREEFDEQRFLSMRAATVSDEKISVGDIVNRRGELKNSEPIPYQASMGAWDICNQYMDRIAGPRFDDGMISQDSFDTTRGDDTGNINRKQEPEVQTNS